MESSEEEITLSESELDSSKEEEYLNQIKEHEKNIKAILDLKELTTELRKNKEYITSIILPDQPLLWGKAAKLYNKINSIKREENKVICGDCHCWKPRGTVPHKCPKTRKHKFQDCPTCNLAGLFIF
jgi:hypothetical protein